MSTVVNAPLIIAGSLAVLGAGLHGIGGELLVVRRLTADALPPSRFGGPRSTRMMLHTTWHLTTVAFVTVAGALLLAGTAVDGEAAQALAFVAAAASTGFAAMTAALALAASGSPRALLGHPAPILLSAIAALAWWGALTTG